MKNKEITSAALGTAFFAIPYVGLSISLAPSLLIGAAAYGASESIFSQTKKKTYGAKKMSVKEIIAEAQRQNRFLVSTINNIESPDSQQNLREITETVNKIIETTETSPSKLKNIDNFFDYYLPVLYKIVARYDEIENQKLSSKEGKAFIKSANNMLK